MKKWNQILNNIMGTFTGVYLGHSAYTFWSYKTHPEFYAMHSAPWYTSILVYGVGTLVVLAVCGLIKLILKYYEKKRKNDQ